jgi:hypothetical protein
VLTHLFTVALPNLTELARVKSSRDTLLAPLRPIPASKDENVRRMLLEAKVESMRESGQAVGEQEGDEDEELRKAVEVSGDFPPFLPPFRSYLYFFSAAHQPTNEGSMDRARRSGSVRTRRTRRLGGSHRLGRIVEADVSVLSPSNSHILTSLRCPSLQSRFLLPKSPSTSKPSLRPRRLDQGDSLGWTSSWKGRVLHSAQPQPQRHSDAA